MGDEFPLAKRDERPDIRTDGGESDGQGAIDHDWEEHEKSTREMMADRLDDYQTEPMPGGIAIDLVSRQPLFIRRKVADSLPEYQEANDFDLAAYKTHPYLPVRLDDAVFECVFIPRKAESAHSIGKTYDYPRGRLMHVPVEDAWLEGGDD